MKKKKDNIFKATIIIRLKPKGEIIYGEGAVESVKDAFGDALFIARFSKPFPKK